MKARIVSEEEDWRIGDLIVNRGVHTRMRRDKPSDSLFLNIPVQKLNNSINVGGQ